MGSITRRPTPPGPITRLFDRLNQLHLAAGEPSLRRITAGIGRGEISYSTVYSALSGPRVPAWGFLKLIVSELGGDPTEFHLLWAAARQTEREEALRVSQPGSRTGRAPDQTQVAPGNNHIVWDSSIPARSPFFSARSTELETLKDRLTQPNEPPVQVLHGIGGVGKTTLAVEFAYRHRSEYDAVWFIKAENEHLIRESLIALGRRLQLHDMRDGHSDHLVETTRHALQVGIPYERSLLILDDAPRHETVTRYLPGGRSHVLVTTHSHGWHHLPGMDVLEILEFTTTEAVDYLTGRVPGLVDQPRVAELAEALTGLPLAVEHAAAFLHQTDTSVPTYLDRFRSRDLATLDPDTDFIHPRAAVISLSLAQEELSTDAAALLQLIVLISPEPISEELLLQPGLTRRLPPELRDILSDSRRYRPAVRELARWSLVRSDGVRNEIQLHRVVQTILARLLARNDPAAEQRCRKAAHLLLSGSDPGMPERDEHETAYQISYPHLVYAGAVTSDHPPLRALVVNQIRRLYLRGRVGEAYNLAYPTLHHWRQWLGENHLQTLELATELSVVLRLLGRGTEAFELTLDTLGRLEEDHGPEHEITLICARHHSTHLRFLGHFEEAQRGDQARLPLYVRTFGEADFQTLNLLNNIAVGLRCMGRYQEALEHDKRTYEGRARSFGPAHMHTLDSQFAIARDLRRLGQYEDSLDELIQLNRNVDRTGEPWTISHLLWALDFGVALRRVGDYQAALNYGEMVLQRHHTLIGRRHQQSLLAATSLITDRLITGDLQSALGLAEETVEGWTEVAGSGHPNTLAAMANLALALRLSGAVSNARQINAQVLAELTTVLGEQHPYCLVVMCNLASDASASGALSEAVSLGESALALSTHVRGEDHPFTLATAANLALDLRASGDPRAVELHEQTLTRYSAQLPSGHPETRAVERFQRINLDVETDHL